MEFSHQNRDCCGFARLKLVLCPIFEICPDWVVFPNRNDLKGHRQMNHEGSISSEQSRNYPEGNNQLSAAKDPCPSNKKTTAAFVDLGIKGNDSKPAHAWRLWLRWIKCWSRSAVQRFDHQYMIKLRNRYCGFSHWWNPMMVNHQCIRFQFSMRFQ